MLLLCVAKQNTIDVHFPQHMSFFDINVRSKRYKRTLYT